MNKKSIAKFAAACSLLATVSSVQAVPLQVDYSWNQAYKGSSASANVIVNDATSVFATNGWSLEWRDINDKVDGDALTTLGFSVEAGYTATIDSLVMYFSGLHNSPTGVFGEVGFSSAGQSVSSDLNNNGNVGLSLQIDFATPFTVTDQFYIDFELFDFDANAGVAYEVHGTSLIGSITQNSTSVPEPATLLMFGLGLAGLASTRKRKNNV